MARGHVNRTLGCTRTGGMAVTVAVSLGVPQGPWAWKPPPTPAAVGLGTLCATAMPPMVPEPCRDPVRTRGYRRDKRCR